MSKHTPTRADALRALAALATGRANDCARLALEDTPPVAELDLTLLQEIRRSANGAVEVHLVDRLKAAELLAALLEQERSDAADFFGALTQQAAE